MHRLCIAAGAIALLLAAIATAERVVAKPGRVVRIERPTRRAPRPIRVCHFTVSRAQMTCVSSDDLEVGEAVDVLADDGSFERVEVTAIAPSRLDSCRLGHAVDVDLRSIANSSAKGGTTRRHSSRFAIRGVAATPGVSKLLTNTGAVRSPSGKADENVFMAADLDGDDQPDLIAALHGRCSEVKKTPPWVPAGKVVTSWCIDYWRRSDTTSAWHLASSEFVHFCQ